MKPLTRARIAGRLKDRREVVALLTGEGWSAHQIAVQLGVTPRTVGRDRVILGIAEPGPRYFTAEEDRRALAMLTDGASLAEVARTLGRSQRTIYKRYPHMGWTPSQTGEYNSLRAFREWVLGD